MISARELWFVDGEWLYDLYDPATGGTRLGEFRGYVAAGDIHHTDEQDSVLLPKIALEVISQALEANPEAPYSISREGEVFTVTATSGETHRLHPDASGNYDVSTLPWTWIGVDDTTPILQAW